MIINISNPKLSAPLIEFFTRIIEIVQNIPILTAPVELTYVVGAMVKIISRRIWFQTRLFPLWGSEVPGSRLIGLETLIILCVLAIQFLLHWDSYISIFLVVHLTNIQIFGIQILSNIIPKLSSSCIAGCPYQIWDFRIFCNPQSLISSQVFKNIYESDE